MLMMRDLGQATEREALLLEKGLGNRSTYLDHEHTEIIQDPKPVCHLMNLCKEK